MTSATHKLSAHPDQVELLSLLAKVPNYTSSVLKRDKRVSHVGMIHRHYMRKEFAEKLSSYLTNFKRWKPNCHNVVGEIAGIRFYADESLALGEVRVEYTVKLRSEVYGENNSDWSPGILRDNNSYHDNRKAMHIDR